MKRPPIVLRSMRSPSPLGLLALLALLGCTPQGEAPHNEDEASSPIAEVQPMNEPKNQGDPASAGANAGSDPLAEAVEAARRALAERLGRPVDGIEVVEHRLVTWRSGAMGCPEPDAMYTQALVPGVWIRLTADGRTYDYHGARGRTPFFCPDERAEAPLPPDDEPLA